MLLDKKTILSSIHLPEKKVDLIVLSSTESTNTYLKHTPLGQNDSLICLAEHQTKGRGRLNREWHSPHAENLYFSMKWACKSLHELSGLSLVMGLAVIEAIEQAYPLPMPLKIKWPNDIFYQQQKLAGILIELCTSPQGNQEIIVGIGINANMEHTPIDISLKPWTSLKQILGVSIDKNQLCSHLISTLHRYLYQFNQLGFRTFIPLWQTRDYLIHQDIVIQTPTETHQGMVIGIDEQGLLLLKTKAGAVEKHHLGEISVQLQKTSKD